MVFTSNDSWVRFRQVVGSRGSKTLHLGVGGFLLTLDQSQQSGCADNRGGLLNTVEPSWLLVEKFPGE
jgi:hypothetical protein